MSNKYLGKEKCENQEKIIQILSLLLQVVILASKNPFSLQPLCGLIKSMFSENFRFILVLPILLAIFSAWFVTWRNLVTFFSMFTAFPNDFLEFLWSKACDEVESNCKSPTAIPEITWEGPSSVTFF